MRRLRCHRLRRGAACAATLAVLLPATAARASWWEAEAPPPRRPLLGAPARSFGPRLGLVLRNQVDALIPAWTLSREATTGVAWGAGIGGELRLTGRHAARLHASYGHAVLSNKQEDREGGISVHPILVRADYVFGDGWWRPYGGLGLGLQPWSGRVGQISTNLENRDGGHPIAGVAALGVELALVANLSVAPEVSWVPVGGGFHTSYWRAGVALHFLL